MSKLIKSAHFFLKFPKLIKWYCIENKLNCGKIIYNACLIKIINTNEIIACVLNLNLLILKMSLKKLKELFN